MSNHPLFAHIGFGHLVNANDVYLVLSVNSRITKRIVKEAKASTFYRVLNLCGGLDAKSVLLMNDNHVILSHISPVTLRYRLSNLKRATPYKPGQQEDHNEDPEDDEYSETDIPDELEEKDEELDEVD